MPINASCVDVYSEAENANVDMLQQHANIVSIQICK
jgi:hypothetical protein